MGRGQDLYKKAKGLIPGGTQLLSKRPEIFLPDCWPSYFDKTKGAFVWDLDGKRYLDMTHCSVGACILGYNDPDVEKAVLDVVRRGNMATLNCPEEVWLAEKMCELHPWAHNVRYTRCGGESMAVAVRIARAATGRDRIAFCGYHGWHDWYLSANLSDDSSLDGHLLPGLDVAGVPRGLQGTMKPFKFNDIDELRRIAETNGNELAAIVMEPVRNEPHSGFLEEVRKLASEFNAVLVFDEVSSGFRLCCGGAHLKYGVEPDVAVFAKAMSNGYPMGCIIGRRSVMDSVQNSFISSTYWTDRIGPAATLATIEKYQRCNVAEHVNRLGAQVQEGWKEIARSVGLSVTVGGIPPLSHFSFDSPLGVAQRTLFVKLMLQHRILAGTSFYPTLAHCEDHIAEYLNVCTKVMSRIAECECEEQLMSVLCGPLAHDGFKRLT